MSEVQKETDKANEQKRPQEEIIRPWRMENEIFVSDFLLFLVANDTSLYFMS